MAASESGLGCQRRARRAEPHVAQHVGRARTSAALLAAPAKQRTQQNSAAHPERAGPGGTAHLLPSEGHRIERRVIAGPPEASRAPASRPRRQRRPAHAPARPRRARAGPRPVSWLTHCTASTSPGPIPASALLRAWATRQPGSPPDGHGPLRLGGGAHGRVLQRGESHSLPTATGTQQEPAHTQVARLGPSAGQHDVRGLGAHGRRRLLARALQQRPRVATRSVHARWVRPRTLTRLRHGPLRRHHERGRRVVVEVDHDAPRDPAAEPSRNTTSRTSAPRER
jgi:hypothetical protein